MRMKQEIVFFIHTWKRRGIPLHQKLGHNGTTNMIQYDPGVPVRYMNSRVLEQIYKVSTDDAYDGVIARFSELYNFLLIKAVFQQIPPLIHLRDKTSVKVGVGTVPNFWEIGTLTPKGWEDIVLPPRLCLQLDDCCGVISGQIHARYAGEHIAYHNTLGQWVNAYFEPHPAFNMI